MEAKDYLNQAIELAKDNITKGGGPFGAVIVRNGEIIARSANTVTLDKDPTAHAEVNAIRSACKRLGTFDLSGCEIYSSCEPCPMCLSAIYWARLDKLYYAATRKDAASVGFDDDYIYKEIPLDNAHRSLPIEHLHSPNATSPFALWEKTEGKTEY